MHPHHEEAYSHSKTLQWMLSDSKRQGTPDGSKRQAWGRTIAVFGALFALMCVMNYFAGSLILSNNTGYLQDLPTYPYFLVFIFTPIFYRRIVESYLATFHYRDPHPSMTDLSTSESILPSIRFDEEYRVEYDALLVTWWKRITLQDEKYLFWYRIGRVILIGLIILFNGIIPALSGTETGSWNFSIHTYPLGFLSNQVKELFKLGIVLPPILYGVVMITLATTKICKNIAEKKRFHLYALAPDKCAGLHQLGGLSLRLFYIVIIQLLYLFAITLVLHMPPAHMFIYPPYIILTVFVFVYPMLSVRSSMKEAKMKELHRLSLLFTQIYDRFQAENKEGNADDKSRKDREDLIAIKELYKEVNSMPIWPYNIDTLARFCSFVLIPVGVFVFQVITNAGNIRESLEFIRTVFNKLIQ